MPRPSHPVLKQSPGTTPCACCKERPHDFIPEHDLDAYVCKECAPMLRTAASWLAQVGIEGCIPENPA